MSYPNFTVEDFAKWNQTSSCFRLPKRLVGQDAVKDVKVALIKAIGAERVSAVQRSQPMEALSPRTSSSPAASSVRVDAAPPASGEQNVDTAIVAIPPTGMELDHWCRCCR